MLSKRLFSKNAIVAKFRVQSRASEILQDQIIKERNGTHKDRRSLAVSEEGA